MCLLQGHPQRRGKGLSSSPSNCTPLQLGQGGRGMTRGTQGAGEGEEGTVEDRQGRLVTTVRSSDRAMK